MKNYINFNLDPESEYPLVCSFYTPNWEYPKWAYRLSENCKSLNLNHYISKYEDRKNYIDNCSIKPNHIKKVMDEANCPILWIDVDGSLLKKPTIFINTENDFMAKKMHSERERYWHVGTIFINNTPLGKEFLNAWVEKTNNIDGSDELALDLIWKENKFNQQLKYSDIPVEYFRIKNKKYEPKDSDVIVHRISKDDNKMKYFESIK